MTKWLDVKVLERDILEHETEAERLKAISFGMINEWWHLKHLKTVAQAGHEEVFVLVHFAVECYYLFCRKTWVASKFKSFLI